MTPSTIAAVACCQQRRHGQASWSSSTTRLQGYDDSECLIEHIKTIEPSCPTAVASIAACARAEYLLEKMATERDSQKMSV